MTSARPRLDTVAVLADTDSRWKWGMATARQLEPASIAAFAKIGPHSASPRQLREAGADPSTARRVSLAEFPQALASLNCQVIIAALPGDACQAMLHALAAHEFEGDRPIVVTGYVGVVFERVVEGVLLRGGADVLLANSPHDARTFRALHRDYGLDPEVVVETPLPFLLPPGSPRSGDPFTVTFAAQPDVPATRSERAYLVDRLVEHARAHPEREVLLKVRGLPGEQLTHPEPYPYPRLLHRRHPDRPANLTVEAGPMGDVLRRTDLLVTVSSTAAVEAAHLGIPIGILSDFGIREALGNPHFGGSGCLVSFDDLDGGEAPVADPVWAADRGLGHTADTGAFRERVLSLASVDRPPLTPFYSLSRSPAYLPPLLASHGLGPDGRRLASASEHNSARKLIRSMSQAIYRHSVNVIAPALRRLAS